MNLQRARDPCTAQIPHCPMMASPEGLRWINVTAVRWRVARARFGARSVSSHDTRKRPATHAAAGTAVPWDIPSRDSPSHRYCDAEPAAPPDRDRGAGRHADHRLGDDVLQPDHLRNDHRRRSRHVARGGVWGHHDDAAHERADRAPHGAAGRYEGRAADHDDGFRCRVAGDGRSRIGAGYRHLPVGVGADRYLDSYDARQCRACRPRADRRVECAPGDHGADAAQRPDRHGLPAPECVAGRHRWLAQRLSRLRRDAPADLPARPRHHPAAARTGIRRDDARGRSFHRWDAAARQAVCGVRHAHDLVLHRGAHHLGPVHADYRRVQGARPQRRGGDRLMGAGRSFASLRSLRRAGVWRTLLDPHDSGPLGDPDDHQLPVHLAVQSNSF